MPLHTAAYRCMPIHAAPDRPVDLLYAEFTDVTNPKVEATISLRALPTVVLPLVFFPSAGVYRFPSPWM
jgi:hypothetical protein